MPVALTERSRERGDARAVADRHGRGGDRFGNQVDRAGATLPLRTLLAPAITLLIRYARSD